MKKYKVIAFDLDGTLTNPERGLIASFSYALDKMGIEYGEKALLKRFIGPPLYDEWRRVYNLSEEDATLALNYFRDYYQIYGWWDNELYDGIHELLRELRARGKKLILATSKPEIFAKKVLNLFDIAKYFDFIGGASTDKTRDKKWEVLEYSMNAVGATREETVLVGDRMFDADGAARLGVDSIAVLYGHGSKEEISSAGFTRITETTETLLDLLP